MYVNKLCLLSLFFFGIVLLAFFWSLIFFFVFVLPLPMLPSLAVEAAAAEDCGKWWPWLTYKSELVPPPPP